MSTGSDNHESGIMNEAGSFEHDEYTEENPIISDSESVSEDDATNLDIESPYTKASKSSSYQAGDLAAAQMMHLMNNSSAAYQALDNGVSVNGLDEKENIPVCKFCNKVFANFSNLNHHVNAIHLNQSKWVCSQCGKVCSSKSNLKVHLRVHLRVKPYHCRWCSYSCMHHSSIRDHLAKVHPDKSHTPLQPGYIFNSHAVPEPDVFNSNNFNLNNFVNDSKLKRSNEDQEQLTPEKIKKPRTSNQRDEPKGFQPVNQKDTPSVTPTNANVSSPIAPNYNLNNPQQMSNIYNAYNMARMLPFMYPMHLQYAAAAAAAGANPLQSQSQANFPSSLFRMVNNNMMQQFSARPTPSFAGLNNNFSINTNFQSLYNNSYSTGTNSNPSNSFEEPTTSSNFSYSNSSRSASLSPSDKTSCESVSLVAKQIKSIVTTSETQTSTESKDEIDVKRENTYSDNLPLNPFSAGSMTTSSPTISTSSPKNTLTVDQILSNKSNKSTQTESSCLKCPYCSIMQSTIK